MTGEAKGWEVSPHVVGVERKGWNWRAYHGPHSTAGWEASKHQAEQSAMVALDALTRSTYNRVMGRGATSALGG